MSIEKLTFTTQPERKPVGVLATGDIFFSHNITNNLTSGVEGSHKLFEAVRLNQTDRSTVFEIGTQILKYGNVVVNGDVLPLTAKTAGNVIAALLPGDVWEDNPLSISLSEIKNNINLLPEPIRNEAHSFIQKARFKEMMSQTITLLYQGAIDLFAFNLDTKTEIEKLTGRAVLKALFEIPEFSKMYESWFNKASSITTFEGSTIPHVFSYILKSLGCGVCGDNAYSEIKKAFDNPHKLKKIKKAFALALTNTGTGDRVVETDHKILPLVSEYVGNSPTWLELTVSRGIVMLGTTARMKNLGITPKWAGIDFYHPLDLLRINPYYHKVCDPSNPWETYSYKDSDPKDAQERVASMLSNKSHVGMFKADFEKPSFPKIVKSIWRSRSMGDYPDVIRMTGIVGSNAIAMENMIKAVNPKGGLIIISAPNSYGRNSTTMWQVFRDENLINVNLIHASDSFPS